MSKRLIVMLVSVFWMGIMCSALYAASPSSPFDSLKRQLLQDGVDSSLVEKIYGHPKVSLDLSVATVYFRHRESKLNYDQFLEDKAIAKAREYMSANKASLEAAEKTYGVDKEIITAILLVETRLGGFVGTKPVINTLSTLAALSDEKNRDLLYAKVSNNKKNSRAKVDAWSARKSTWAYKELKAYLQHMDASQADPTAIKGSFAGALGYSQFVPTSILAYGTDGSGDGKVDLFNHSDAIASIARYLQGNGWKSGMDAQEMGKVLLRYNNSTYYANTLLRIRAVLREAS